MAYTALFDYKKLKNVVVYAEPDKPVEPTAVDPKKTYMMTVSKIGRSIDLSPPFLVLPAGSEVTFVNKMEEAMTVYSSGGSVDRFMAELPPQGASLVKLGTVGLYRVGCIINPSAAAKIFAAGPIFAVAGEDGRYAMDLPAGSYKVTAWHERLPSVTLETVVVKEGENRTVDFTLSVRQLPEIK